MSEGETNQGEKILEYFELETELSTLVQQEILPQKIAQRIIEKIKEKNIKITKKQLYSLVEKIQQALKTYTIPQGNQLKGSPDGRHTSDDSAIQTLDIKRLFETIEHLNTRITVIEHNQLDSLKGANGTLVKTKDIEAFVPTGLLEENVQPLQHIPNDPESIVIIMKFLQYLVDRLGKHNLGDALGYYVDIGWISEDVRFDLLNYSKGITEEPTQNGQYPPHLPAKDHLQSLLFIQKIKGVQLDDRFLNRIERDMEKIVKSTEGHKQT
jgi:archaellum component FlaD/FlaE